MSDAEDYSAISEEQVVEEDYQDGEAEPDEGAWQDDGQASGEESSEEAASASEAEEEVEESLVVEAAAEAAAPRASAPHGSPGAHPPAIARGAEGARPQRPDTNAPMASSNKPSVVHILAPGDRT